MCTHTDTPSGERECVVWWWMRGEEEDGGAAQLANTTDTPRVCGGVWSVVECGVFGVWSVECVVCKAGRERRCVWVCGAG